jgi:hypothetical protein
LEPVERPPQGGFSFGTWSGYSLFFNVKKTSMNQQETAKN